MSISAGARACCAVLGRWTFWPVPPDPGPAGGQPVPLSRPVRPGRFLHAVGRRPLAALVTAVVAGTPRGRGAPAQRAAGGGVAGGRAARRRPGARAADAAAAGGPGILAPTALVVSTPGIADDRAVGRAGAALDAQPEVAGVLGPRDQPLPLPLGLFLAPDGGAARYLLILDSDPLAAEAIDGLRALQRRMPTLLTSVGLAEAETSWTGDTALGLSLVDGARQDLVRVAVAVVIVDLVLLMVFLRALVAPLYLLATSVLAVGAALGIDHVGVPGPAGRDGIIFYVPFAAAVLLVSLGSDYNIFSVGYIGRRPGGRRSLADALAVAVPRSTRRSTRPASPWPSASRWSRSFPSRPSRTRLRRGRRGPHRRVRRALAARPRSGLARRPASGWPGRRLAVQRPRRR